MITGAHFIIYSKDAEADRIFFRDVFKFPNVDVGDGWLIFALPESEMAVHPAAKNDQHELYFLCDNVENFIIEMKKKKVRCGKLKDQGWGLLVKITLPGGGKLGIYQARHSMPGKR